MARSLSLLVVAVLLVSSAACFPEAEQGSDRTSEDVRDETAHREATNTIDVVRTRNLETDVLSFPLDEDPKAH